MDTQSNIDIVNNASQGLASFQRQPQTHFNTDRATGKSWRPEDLMVAEIDRLLGEVTRTLDSDLSTASMAAGRLAELLAGKLRQDLRCAPARGGLAPWQRRKIQSYVEERLEEPLFGKDLAKLVSLSTSYFCHAFKASYGEPPYAYVVRMRIERAKTLMLTTKQSLSQIALACGLVDQAHLCRRFRQATGTTPGAWRRSHAIGF